MEKNYTPVDLNKFQHKKFNKLNLILLIIATITVAVLAVLLTMLIKKNSSEEKPPVIHAPTKVMVSPTVEPSPQPTEVIQETPLPASTEADIQENKPTPEVTTEATGSSKVNNPSPIPTAITPTVSSSGQ